MSWEPRIIKEYNPDGRLIKSSIQRTENGELELCLDCEQCVCDDCDPKAKPLDKSAVFPLALEAGFMLSTQYGQGADKLMPACDPETLMALVKAIERAHGITK